jgi:hypothetical protein
MEGPLWELLIPFWSVNKHGRHRQFLFLIGRFLKQHRCILPSCGSFGKAVLEDKIFRNRPIRNKNCLWRPCLLTFLIWNCFAKMNRYLVGSTYGRFCIKFPQSDNLLMDRDEMSSLYRGPPIDASYQVSVHLAKRFQKRRILIVSGPL